MKRITIITGNQGTGKTKLAMEMTKDMKAYFHTYMYEHTFLENITKAIREAQPDVVIYDVFFMNRPKSIVCLNMEEIIVRLPYQGQPLPYKMPKIIFCISDSGVSDSLQKWLKEIDIYEEHIDVINL
jgi:hypothetical protein